MKPNIRRVLKQYSLLFKTNVFEKKILSSFRKYIMSRFTLQTTINMNQTIHSEIKHNYFHIRITIKKRQKILTLIHFQKKKKKYSHPVHPKPPHLQHYEPLAHTPTPSPRPTKIQARRKERRADPRGGERDQWEGYPIHALAHAQVCACIYIYVYVCGRERERVGHVGGELGRCGTPPAAPTRRFECAEARERERRLGSKNRLLAEWLRAEEYICLWGWCVELVWMKDDLFMSWCLDVYDVKSVLCN